MWGTDHPRLIIEDICPRYCSVTEPKTSWLQIKILNLTAIPVTMLIMVPHCFGILTLPLGINWLLTISYKPKQNFYRNWVVDTSLFWAPLVLLGMFQPTSFWHVIFEILWRASEGLNHIQDFWDTAHSFHIFSWVFMSTSPYLDLLSILLMGNHCAQDWKSFKTNQAVLQFVCLSSLDEFLFIKNRFPVPLAASRKLFL